MVCCALEIFILLFLTIGAIFLASRHRGGQSSPANVRLLVVPFFDVCYAIADVIFFGI